MLVGLKVRLEVRWIGKAATFGLMCGIPLVAWGNFGLSLHRVALPVGWVLFWIGIVLYYIAAAMYAMDTARAVRMAPEDRRI